MSRLDKVARVHGISLLRPGENTTWNSCISPVAERRLRAVQVQPPHAHEALVEHLRDAFLRSLDSAAHHSSVFA